MKKVAERKAHKRSGKKQSKVHKSLKKIVNLLADSLELIASDLAGSKRRRNHSVYRLAPRQLKPIVIVKVVRDK